MNNEATTQQPTESQVKFIDLEKGVFTANGNTYTIEGDLTIERYAEFQILERELALGISAKDLYSKLNELFTMVNSMQFADSAVMLNDLIRGQHKLQEREPTVLRICALFMNTPDEDRSVITNDMITKKIADWKAEGIAMQSFFAVASSSVNGFIEIYQRVTRIISGLEKPGRAGNL